MVLARLNTEIDFGVEQQISSRGFSSTERKISPNINRTDVGAFTDMEWKQIRKEREVQGEAIKFATSHLKSIF